MLDKAAPVEPYFYILVAHLKGESALISHKKIINSNDKLIEWHDDESELELAAPQLTTVDA